MTTFTPKRINAKASKAGKTYWEVETDQGNATCFDYPIVQELERNLGKPVSLYDLETNEKGFINLRPAKKGFSQAPQSQQTAQPIAQPIANVENFKEARMAKDISIYTSYAKDIYLEMMKDGKEILSPKAKMEIAIALVKQAKAAFETETQTQPKVTNTFQA